MKENHDSERENVEAFNACFMLAPIMCVVITVIAVVITQLMK